MEKREVNTWIWEMKKCKSLETEEEKSEGYGLGGVRGKTWRLG